MLARSWPSPLSCSPHLSPSFGGNSIFPLRIVVVFLLFSGCVLMALCLSAEKHLVDYCFDFIPLCVCTIGTQFRTHTKKKQQIQQNLTSKFWIKISSSWTWHDVFETPYAVEHVRSTKLTRKKAKTPTKRVDGDVTDVWQNVEEI